MPNLRKQQSGPKSLHETPLVPIEIAGEKHHLRFNARAVGRLETELDRGILEIYGLLLARKITVRLVLSAIAAGIAHEYLKGQEPTWEDVGQDYDTLEELYPVVPLVLDALYPAIGLKKDAPAAPASEQPAQPEADPNAPAPA